MRDRGRERGGERGRKRKREKEREKERNIYVREIAIGASHTHPNVCVKVGAFKYPQAISSNSPVQTSLASINFPFQRTRGTGCQAPALPPGSHRVSNLSLGHDAIPSVCPSGPVPSWVVLLKALDMNWFLMKFDSPGNCSQVLLDSFWNLEGSYSL